MKVLFLLFWTFSVCFLAIAQNPKTISYQGVARNASGQSIPNQSIKIRLSLLDAVGSANSLYIETHSPTTSGLGLFAVQLGGGTVVSGNYDTLHWNAGPRFVKTEIDPSGGNNYTLTTTSPFNAVPYALHALSGTPGPQGVKGDTGVQGPQGTYPSGNAIGDMQYWDGNQWVMIPVGQQGSSLKNCEGQITWGACKPQLTTTNPSSLSSSSFATGGNVYDDGDAPVTVRGMCWSTNPDPTTANSKTSDGSGVGSFARTIGSLSLGTTYYVRAYATNIAGTSYGNQLTITTLNSTIPSVTTTAVTLIDGNNTNSGGNVTSNGGAAVTVRGVVWDTLPGPTIGLTTKTVNGAGNGVFTSSMAGLRINTVYYVRAYATNSAGTGYGNQITFTSAYFSAGGGVTDIDGNAYNSIVLGTQEWMKENLKVSKYRNGITIPSGLDNTAWAASATGAFSIYNNSAANNTTYGKLYNYYAMTDPRELCPIGWHDPGDSDWKTLEIYLGMASIEADQTGGRGITANVGGKFKSVSALWTNANTGATNASGFSGLPGGQRDETGVYKNLGFFGFFWTSDIEGATYAYYRTLNYDVGTVGRYSYFKQIGFSVRCVKD